MTPQRYKVLVYAQDAGGARAILPVVDRLLHDQSLEVQVLTRGKATRLFKEAGITAAGYGMDSYSTAIDSTSALSVMRQAAPDLLLSTTSHPRDPSNSRLIRAARESGIPSVAILDHWKGWDRLGEAVAGSLEYAPDELGVMDRYAKHAIISRGMPPGHVHVVGHPYLERIYGQRQRLHDAATVFATKRRLGLDPDCPIVLFCSEVVHAHAYSEPCDTGCELLSQVRVEQVKLIDVLRSVTDEIASKCGLKLQLVMRSHPNWDEKPTPGVWLMDQEVVSDEMAVALASVVLGLSSMPLIEATLLGKPSGSLAFFDGWSPAKAFVDVETWAALPFFTVIQGKEELRPFLVNGTAGQGAKNLPHTCHKEVIVGSADRVVGLISNLLKQQSISQNTRSE